MHKPLLLWKVRQPGDFKVEKAEHFLFSAAHLIKHYRSVFFCQHFFYKNRKWGNYQYAVCNYQWKKIWTRNINSSCITIMIMLLTIFINWNILKLKVFQSIKELKNLWKDLLKILIIVWLFSTFLYSYCRRKLIPELNIVLCYLQYLWSNFKWYNFSISSWNEYYRNDNSLFFLKHLSIR